MKIYGAILVLMFAAACGSEPAPRPAFPADQIIQNVFQAELPASATNPQVLTVRAMTAVVYGKFECSEPDLREFLGASALLPEKLANGANPLQRIQGHDIEWWQAASLRNPSGVQCQWDNGEDVATCMLAAGQSEESDLVTVYFMVIYEGKGQTGLRPAVKADPNWQLEETSVSDKPDGVEGDAPATGP
jgi:hypothetical protein